MDKPLLHVFRNTPFGRETLLQSAYFCKQLHLPISIYLPKFQNYLMYFGTDILQMDLDDSYLTDPETAKQHFQEIIDAYQLDSDLVQPTGTTGGTLPELPVNFSIMTCPRSMSDDTRKNSLGIICTKVRNIVQAAHAPVFLPSPVFKPWTRIAVLYGGSQSSAASLRLGLEFKRRTDMPLQVFSQGDRSKLESQLLEQDFSADEISSFDWQFWPEGDITDSLYEVPHDSLVLLGAYGKNTIKEALFGSNMEKVQSHLPNSMVIVGPKCDWLNR